jgi:hypothetical protein
MGSSIFPGVPCRARWSGVDFLTDGTHVLMILSWSDWTDHAPMHDVYYRLYDCDNDRLVQHVQRDLLARQFDAAANDHALVIRAKARMAEQLRAALHPAS